MSEILTVESNADIPTLVDSIDEAGYQVST